MCPRAARALGCIYLIPQQWTFARNNGEKVGSWFAAGFFACLITVRLRL